MRLPLTKLYRAFPALDPFPDDVARRYVRRVTRGRFVSTWVLTLIGFLGGYVTFGLVFGLIGASLTNLVAGQSGSMLNALGIAMAVTTIAVTLGTGPLCALLARDVYIKLTIRSRIDQATCAVCDFSLLGLPTRMEPGIGKVVTCAECGTVNRVAFGKAEDELVDKGERVARVIHPFVRRFSELSGLEPKQRRAVIDAVEAGAWRRTLVSSGVGVAVALVPALSSAALVLSDAVPVVHAASRMVSSDARLFAAVSLSLVVLWPCAAWAKRGVRGFLTHRAVAREIAALEGEVRGFRAEKTAAPEKPRVSA